MSNRVDFYVLPDASPEARLQFASKLCQKALRHGLCIHVLLESHEQSSQLDEQLWCSQPESYLPHALSPAPTPEPPITLSADHTIPEQCTYLINLTSRPIATLKADQRLSEVVIQKTEILEQTRKHYRHYQQAGYQLHMHNL